MGSRFAEYTLGVQKVGKVFEKTGSTSECETLFLEVEAPSEMTDASCCFTYERFCKPCKDLEEHEWGFQMAELFGESGAAMGMVEIHRFSIFSYAGFSHFFFFLFC